MVLWLCAGMQTQVPRKRWWKSKTLWTNVVVVLATVFRDVREWLHRNPVDFAVALSAVNVLLRFVTQSKLSLDDDDASGGGGSGTTGAGVVVPLLLVGFALLTLPSCSVIGSAISGAPIPATTVVRAVDADAMPIQVVSADLAVAEEQARDAERAGTAPPVHGLYDAGRAAKAAREVFTGSSK